MLNFLFISYYKIFLRTKDGTPIFAAVCVLSLVIVLWLFLPLIIIKKYSEYNIFSTAAFKYYYIIVHLTLIIFLYRFFKKEKVNKVLALFESKPIFFKRFWFLLAVFAFLVPTVSIPFLLTK